MELRLTVLRPGQSLSSREHRLVFETNTPSNAPVPQGNLGEFDRLHQGSDQNRDQRPEGQDRRDNVYDRMTNRQAAYRDEVAKLEQYIAKSAASSESQGTIKRVNGLIENLRNVYQQEYTDRNGTRRTYENGMYATVNAVESAYNNIETIITSLEGDLARANGGTLPEGLRSYQDRVRDARTADALAGRGTGSVDVRAYSVPFRPSSAAEVSSYSLLRVPANFQFRWNANARVAEIISGKYDIQGGMSNGIKYLRVRPDAATALARENLSIPVAIESAPGRVQQMTTARFVPDSPIVENPNAGNTLIHIEYSAPVAVGAGGPGGDLPNGGEGGPGPGPGPNGNGNGNNENLNNPEAQEGARKAFNTRWMELKGASETAEKEYSTAATSEDPTVRLATLNAYRTAVTAEAGHLGTVGTVPHAADDARLATYASRANEINGSGMILESLNTQAEQLNDLVGFTETAARVEGETAIALSAIPVDLPAGDDTAGWEARVALINTALSRLGTESEHLATFAGSPGARVASETLTKTVADRIDAVTKSTAEQTKALTEATEGVDEARRQVYHTEWQRLNKETMGASMAFGNADREDVSATISALQPYIDAIIAESGHLEVRTSIPASTDTSDTRAATWETRAGEVITLQTEMETMMGELRDLQAFQAVAEDYQTSTENLKSVYTEPLPEPGDVAGWQARIDAGDSWKAALVLEEGHLGTFPGSEGENVATDAHKQAVTDRVAAVAFDIPEADALLAEAQEGKNEAERQVFDTEFNRLNGESRSAASWEDGDPEDTASKIDLLKAYVAALTAENEHLAGASVLPDTKENDERFTTWSERSAELGGDGGLIDQMQQQLEKFEAFQEFDGNATAYENETKGAYEAIPDTDPVANDLEGWESMKTLSEAYVTTLEVEEAHLETFADSLAESGATETQAQAVRDRLQTVKDELKDMRDTEMPRVEEARNEAECLVFEEKWKDLKATTDAAKTGYEEALNNGVDATTRLSELVDYVKAMEAEDEHLGTLNREVHKPGDPRLDDYTNRIGDLATALPEMTTMKENLEDYVEFEAKAYENAETSDTAKNAIPDVPTERGDVEGWGDRKQMISDYLEALNTEAEHLEGLASRPGLAAANAQEIGDAFDQYMYVLSEEQAANDQLTQATEGLNDATRDKFEDTWKDLNDTSVADGGTHAATLASEVAPGAKITDLQTYRGSLQRELTHLNGAAALPVKEGDGRPEQYSKRTGEVMTIIGDLNALEANLNSLATFNEGATKFQEASEKTDKIAIGAINAMDPAAENLPQWTARRDAVRNNVNALTAEKAHLETFVAGNPAFEAATPGQRTEVATRLEAVNKLLPERQEQLTAMQRGVDTASVDNITTIDTAGPVRVNRTSTADRVVNRYQAITLTQGSHTITIAAGADLTGNREWPTITREAGNNNIRIAGLTGRGTYEIRVGTKTSTIRVDAPPRGRNEPVPPETETKEKIEKDRKEDSSRDPEGERASIDGLPSTPLVSGEDYNMTINPNDSSFQVTFNTGSVIQFASIPAGLPESGVTETFIVGDTFAPSAYVTRDSEGNITITPRTTGTIDITPVNGDTTTREVRSPNASEIEARSKAERREKQLMRSLPENGEALVKGRGYIWRTPDSESGNALTLTFTSIDGTAQTFRVPPVGAGADSLSIYNPFLSVQRSSDNGFSSIVIKQPGTISFSNSDGPRLHPVS